MSTDATPTPNSRPGRPRQLDDPKRREILALVSSGCTVAEAARYVGCAASTIHRERKQNQEFRTQLRKAQADAETHALRAMRAAIDKHWGAAGWWLERTNPDRFARRNPLKFGPKQARALMDDILTLIDDENIHPLQSSRLKQRVLAAMEYAIRTTWDTNRSYNSLRKALDFRDQKERPRNPIATWPDDRILPKPIPPSSTIPFSQPAPAPSSNPTSPSGRSPNR
jgi:hypothetical protein